MKTTTSNTHALLTGTILVTLILLSGCGTAIGDRIQEGAERGVQQATERETQRRADRATTQVIEGFENAVRCAVGDRACAERARAEGRDVVYVDEDGNVVSTERNAPENVNANYDFQRGERILFRDDFTRDNVGDFPRRLELVNGSWEIVEWEGRRLVRIIGGTRPTIKVPLPEVLPERFTIEFDVHLTSRPYQKVFVATSEPENVGHDEVTLGETESYFRAGSSENWTGLLGPVEVTGGGRQFTEEIIPFRIMVDDSHAKVYMGSERVANVPNANFTRTRHIWIASNNWAEPDAPVYVGPITVAAGGKDLYSTLEAEGRVTTEGIFFDTGSARIRSESAAALGEIAAMLREHSDLRLRIEGHTDNTGSASSNQTLSESRAQAVRDYLVNDEGISASRLEAEGMGEDHPVADNSTEAGRQQNRRVDLVRL